MAIVLMFKATGFLGRWMRIMFSVYWIYIFFEVLKMRSFGSFNAEIGSRGFFRCIGFFKAVNMRLELNPMVLYGISVFDKKKEKKKNNDFFCCINKKKISY